MRRWVMKPGYARRRAAATSRALLPKDQVSKQAMFETGVELSHTHVTLQADQDGQLYDVAMDNVFASGYDATGEGVPSPLSSIAVGDKLELFGELYQKGGVGNPWVHTDCGTPRAATAPDGWAEIVEADGAHGPNLEGSEAYCKLWRRWCTLEYVARSLPS
jgi:hypothetical protein